MSAVGQSNYILFPSGKSEWYGVIGTSANPMAELHGMFDTKVAAEAFIARLKREYSDYDHLQVVNVTLGLA